MEIKINSTAFNKYIYGTKNQCEPADINRNSSSAFKTDNISFSSKKATEVFGERPIKINDQFVKNVGGNFSLDGKPFKFVGTNMYSLAFENRETSEKMVQDAAKEGFTVIRFWAFPQLKKEKIEEICDLAKKYNVKLIPSFSTQWGLPSEQKKDDYFYREGYKKDYLPFVKSVVSSLKDRPEIFLWELINEPETEKFENMYNFAKDVSGQVDSIDKNHMISIGTIGGLGDKFGSQFSRLDESLFKKLYSLPTLDAVSIHDYSYDSTTLERFDILFRFQNDMKKARIFGKLDEITSVFSKKLDKTVLDNFNSIIFRPMTVRGVWTMLNQQDQKIAKDLGKPLYIGEVGFKKFHGEDRKKLIDLDISRQIQQGAQGYILWSFEAQGKSVDGHDYGFAQKDGFSDLIKKWNTKLSDISNN